MSDQLWAGRYRRDRLLGRGAMGEVWAALDVVLDRQVAIKSISASRTDPEDLERMAREARVAARIGHPNAVAVHDLLTVDDRPNLVMEYVDGDTLADLVRRDGRIDPRRVAAIGAAVADALAEAHRLGVVHRDIKPANILITPRGVPKLADFGIARLDGDANMTATGMMIGTPAYMAPEIVEGGLADARSDVWSLGVTLYAALEGSPPFVVRADDEPFVVLGRVMHAPVRPPACGGTVARAVTAMLDRDPARRPTAQQVTELLRDARTAPAGHDTTRLPQPAADLTQAFDRRPGAPVAAPGSASASGSESAWAESASSSWSDATRTDRRPSDHRPPGPPPAPPPAYRSSPPRASELRGPEPRGPEPRVSDPLLPGVWSSGEYLPPGDPRPERRSGRTVAVVAAAVVIVLVGVGAVLLLRAHGGSSPSADPATNASARGGSTPSGSTPTGEGSTGAASTGGSPSGTPTPGAGQRYYTGPGGITVIAPTGWQKDTSADIPNIVDYRAPGTTDRTTGTFFRIGIGNPNSSTAIGQVASDAKGFLSDRSRSGYRHVRFLDTSTSTFLGHDAVEIEYTGTNSEGVARHGIEHLWLSGGITLEINMSAPADGWDTALPVYRLLIAEAREAS